MAEQTNAEVSDERLREIGGWAKLVSTFPQAEGHPPPERYADIAAVCTELLTRRSVTSQASEGAVAAQLTAGSSHLVYDADEKQALMFLAHHVLQPDDDSGFGSEYARIVLNIMVRFEQALKVAPVSKRVERLETALQQIKARTYSDDRGCALAADAVAEISDIALQALQGGRS